MSGGSATIVAPAATVVGASTSSAELSRSRLRRFTSQDLSSFIAQEARVEIVPRFSLPSVTCISGTYGPFTPNYPVVVPLWMALYFRETETCSISPPAFLARSFLQDLLERERQSDNTFESIHFHFFEIAKMMFDVAVDDIADSSEVMRLVPEIAARRREKILSSMSTFQDPTQSLRIPALKVSNLVSLELQYLRDSFAGVLNAAHELEQRAGERDRRSENIAEATSSARGGSNAGRISDATSVAMTDATSESRTSVGSVVGSGRSVGGTGGGPLPPSVLGDDGLLGDATTADPVPSAPQVPRRRRTLRQK